MIKFLSIFIITLGLLFLIGLNKPTKENITIQTSQHVAKLNNLNIRLLILKHAKEQMATDDANLAVQAANLAEQNGLNIQSIGQFFIDSNGKNWTNVPFPNLKDFISNNMKINATKGDTIIVMTIGHGAKGGYLMDIGQRKDLLNTIAQAAQENNQETLWWQLSCYASSNLPNINQLSSQQQKLISIVASSDENTESPAYVEGNIMKELFLIMANKPNDIDLDDNSIVSANELALTLNKIKPNRGKLVYAISPNEPVFGLGLAKLLKIIDHNTKQISNDPEFIQLPPLNQPIPKF